MSPARVSLWVILLVALLSLGVRVAADTRVALDDSGHWGSFDPDSLYHMRRLERALAGEGVAARDPFLAYPQERLKGGQAIPWPPLYTRLMALAAAPLAPRDGEARRRFVERFVASLPLVFSVATTIVVALAAFRLAGRGGTGPLAAWVAGLLHAFVFSSVRYGALGNGDHHAFVTLLLTLVVWLLAESLRTLGASPVAMRRAPLLACLSGALAGAMLASWVAGMMHIATCQLALGVGVLVVGAQRRRQWLRLGLAWHAGLLLVLMPFVATSPWSSTGELAFVTLSLQQPLAIGIGALFFVWLALALPRAGARPHAIHLVGLAALALIVAWGRSPMGHAVGQAFEWVAAQGEFMQFVRESQGLARDPTALIKHLGLAVLLLPWALIAAGLALWRERRLDFLPWMACGLGLFVLALLQRRFAEAAVVPQCVLIGWLASAVLRSRGETTGARPRAWIWIAALLAALASNFETSWRAAHSLTTWGQIVDTPDRRAHRARREALRWLDGWAPPVDASRPEYSVLAQWNEGHSIEWVARRPTVASNFGTYLGRESYLAPWRFLLSEDEESGEALLEERGVRFVFLTARWRQNLDSMVGVLHPGEEADFLPRLGGSRWMRSLGARLIAQAGGAARFESPGDIGFLRLVHVAHDVDPTEPGPAGPLPAAWIYERVPGARIEVQGTEGDLLAAVLHLEYVQAGVVTNWRGSALVDASGRALLRVPYSTEVPNGDGHARGRLRWSLSGRSGEVAVSEAAVLDGQTLVLD